MSDPKSPGLASLVLAGEGVQDAVPINESIYMSQGISNSYLVTTDAGNVMINSGSAHEVEAHRKRYAAVSTSPLKYMIFTQSHGDHTGGADALREADTQIIAQANYHDVKGYWRRLAPFYGARTQRLWGAVLGDRQNRSAEIPPDPEPDILFGDRHTFEVGGTAFELYATPGGETTDSLVVWLPQTRTVFTGNLFGPIFHNFPFLYTIRGDKIRSALKFVQSVDRVMALEPELLITGHGEPIKGADTIRTQLQQVRDAVMYVHDETVKGMNAGKDVRTIMGEIRLPDDIAVSEGHGKVSWGARAIFEEHAGWFHFESTTELYGVAPSAVWPEVVEMAGGPDALASRASTHVAEGDPLMALHLLDMALSVSPANRAALEVKRAALDQLLEATGNENFSEVRWLQSQIEEIDAALNAQ